MKKGLLLLVLSLQGACFAGWNVTDLGAGAWAAVTDPAAQTATFEVSDMPDGAVEMSWTVNDDDVSAELIVNTGSWVWTDNELGDTYTFDHTTNVWKNNAETDVWSYAPATKRWTQTIGGSEVWEFDGATGYWVEDPDGTPISWQYHESTREWERMTDNEKVIFYYDGTAAATPGMSGSPTPPYNLRQLNELRIVWTAFIAAGALSTGPTANLTITDDGDGTWSGSNTANNEKIAYDSSVADLSITWQNNGTHNSLKNSVRMAHNHETGCWTWTNELVPLWPTSSEYQASGATWTDSHTGEQWTYTPGTKTWIKGSDTWQHDEESNRWTHNPGGAEWVYSSASGRWTYDPDATPWVFEYDFAADTWIEIVGHDAAEPTRPPFAVVQKALIDQVYAAVRDAGALIVNAAPGWQEVTTEAGVSTARNAGDTQAITYTPADVGSELAWQDDDEKQSFTYNIATGAWTWLNSVDPDDSYSWSFNAGTQRWALSGSDAYWQYTASSRQWQNSAETITWQYQAATARWKHMGTAHEWSYSATTGNWTNHTDSSVWRYNNAYQLWQTVENAPDPLPADTALPPLALIQQELIGYALNHFATAKLFSSSGLFGWTLTAQGDDVWQGTNVVGDEQLLYNPARTPYVIENRNTGAVVAQQATLILEYDLTGEWRVTNSLNPAAPKVTSFTPNTQRWTAANGTTPWLWQTSPTTRFYEVATERTWTFTPTNKRWIDSMTSAQWSYEPTTGVWTNHTATTGWKYDLMAEIWTQVSGTTVSAEDMPPRPVIERALMSHIFELVAARGVFVSVKKMNITLTEQLDDSWLWNRVGGNESLTFDGSLAGKNRLQWATTDNSRTWQFDPETGDWRWEAVTTGGDTLVWKYEAATKTWHDVPQTASWQLEDNLVWRNTADIGDAWQYDPIAKQWTNLKTNTVWGYFNSVATQPADDMYMWTNITNSTGWKYDEKAQGWVQTAGYPELTSDLPPKPIRQMTLIHVAWLAAIASEVFGLTKPHGWDSIARQSNGTWQGMNQNGDQTMIYDARHQVYHVQTLATELPAWAQDKVQWWYTPTGSWQYRNSLDPFVSQHWLYDAATGQWNRSDYEGAAYWTYDGDELTWTHQTTAEQWQFLPENGRWRDGASGREWVYANGNGLWSEFENSSIWHYDYQSNFWVKAFGVTPENVVMPPRVVTQHEVVYHMGTTLRDADAFDEHAQLDWQAGEYEWLGSSSLNNAQARYDTRQSYQLNWRDTHTQNSMQYSTSSEDWTWRADDQHWWYRATDGLWGRDTRTSQEEWLYDATAADTPWVSSANSEIRWVYAAPHNWTYQPTGAVWTYTASSNSWTTGTQQWRYNFATGAWIELTNTRSQPSVLPPLPLVQQQFVLALYGSLTTFFDNPLYAAAQSAPPAQHPLYGTRPLDKNKYYQRYSCSSVLLNANLTLDHVTWVHNDVSRNLGRLQVPSVSANALPAIMGGDRAALWGEQWAPQIKLLDSRIACHEPLVSAGVRWNVHERPIDGTAMSAVDAYNTSSIMAYNRGRVRDMPQRRGMVFQLGSTANRMANGTIAASIQDLGGGIASSSSLRDAFIDIYRAAPTSKATVDEPTKIELALTTAQEPGVSAGERAYQLLHLAHRSRINIGWPTRNADTTYTPWQATNELIAVKEAAEAVTLFSPSLTGGGQLSVSGHNWCFTARDSNNRPPTYPVKTLDVDGVLYVDHGGILQATGSFDAIVDTIVAHRVDSQEHANGRVLIPNDQLSIGANGRIQPYQINFSTAAQSSGEQQGHVLFPVGAAEIATGDQFQADSLNKVK